MRILWHSNAPWVRTGYGVQTRLAIDALRKHHDMGLSGFYGVEGSMLNMGGIPMYPKAMAPYGQDIVGAHAQHFKADIIITLIDAWVMEPAQMGGARWCPWFPVDSEPISPTIVDKVKQAYQPLVFSHFGEEQARNAGLDPLYVPHMVDTKAMYPIDRADARQQLGIGNDRWVVLGVAANKDFPSRKAWPEMLEAFAAFQKARPEALMWCHTMPVGGVNLPALAETLGIPAHALKFSDPYQNLLGFPDEYLRALYSAGDVLLNPAMGEGFGVPILEAQACGCPVIVGGWTAMQELCWNGFAIDKSDAERSWCGEYRTWMWRSHTGAIVAALCDQYAIAGLREKYAAEGVKAAAEYDVATVAEKYWLPVLKQIEDRIGRGAGEVRMVKF